MKLDHKFSKRGTIIAIVVVVITTLLGIATYYLFTSCKYSPSSMQPTWQTFNPIESKIRGCHFKWQCNLLPTEAGKQKCYERL